MFISNPLICIFDIFIFLLLFDVGISPISPPACIFVPVVDIFVPIKTSLQEIVISPVLSRYIPTKLPTQSNAPSDVSMLITVILLKLVKMISDVPIFSPNNAPTFVLLKLFIFIDCSVVTFKISDFTLNCPA